MNFERLKKIFEQKKYNNLEIKPGQYLEINELIWEWSNKRNWKFKGLVLKVKRKGLSDGTFTVRWKSAWITLEKIYPISYSGFEKVTLLDEYKIRRAKLYYIREKVGKKARMKSIANAEKGKEMI